MRLTRIVPLAIAVSMLAACPEERPDAKRPLPRERFPPAVTVQPRRDAAAIGPPAAGVGSAVTAPAAVPTPGVGPSGMTAPDAEPRPVPAGTPAPAR